MAVKEVLLGLSKKLHQHVKMNDKYTIKNGYAHQKELTAQKMCILIGKKKIRENKRAPLSLTLLHIKEILFFNSTL